MTSVTYAILSLTPNAEFTCTDEDYDQINWLSPEITKPTRAQVDAKIAELQAAEPMRILREERDRLIAESDWMANSDVTMSDAWRTYRQALRDLPANTSDPANPVWPTKPS